MGNSSSKDERRARPADLRNHGGHAGAGESSPSQLSPGDRLAGRIYASRNGSASFMQLVRGESNEAAAPERVRETRQEREARRAERDRQARLKEREKSMQEEHVDGGFLVTVGVYTGPEDFSKQIVRQLQIERRLAPFWKGLNDHNDSWTEAQLVAAVKDLPIPEPDSIPPDMARTGSQASSNPTASDINVNSLMVPITSRSQSYQSDRSASLSASHPAFSSNNSGPSSPTTPSNPNNPLFRGRAKTLASTLTGKTGSQDLTPQEIRLPGDRYVNGQPLEAYLYKDAAECPICFMYYPPYLNRTRCCDQSICSECFVQIKRPDPHPPEHEQPGQPREPRASEEEPETLVSEVAACPFCVTPEFGVTYEPPPFRRGLAYAHQQLASMRNPTSAMSSSSSLGTGAARRRATSLSANAPGVVTTDRVRPDWYKKLTDARAHALRRSAAATALHNAAYVLGNQADVQLRSSLIGRRRRTIFGESTNASGSGTPQEGMSPAEYEAYFRPANTRRQGDASGDLVAGRSSSRRHRVEDIEELMMMEAIRQSLADEEDRKRKEDKAAEKDAKKKAKADKKEEKKAEKAAKKNGGSASMYRAGTNDSTSTWGSAGMARSSSNLGNQAPIPEEQLQEGKGKQPVQDFAGFNPLSEPSSTLNRGESPSPPATATTTSDPQRHLEESRANLQPNTHSPLATPSPRLSHFRQLSSASSASSSFVDAPATPGTQQTPSGVDSTAGAQQDGSNTASPTPSNVEPLFNFRSLAAMIGEEDKTLQHDEHIEDAGTHNTAEEQMKEPSPTGSPRMPPAAESRARGDSGESSSSAPPPIYVEHREGDEITSAPRSQQVGDAKEFGSVDVADHGHAIR